MNKVNFVREFEIIASIYNMLTGRMKDGTTISQNFATPEDCRTWLNTNCYDIATLAINDQSGSFNAMRELFNGCLDVSSLNVKNLNTSGATDMYRMFCNCRNISTLDVSHFDTSNVTDMQYMFGACEKLKTLDISNFDSSKVLSIESMLSQCEGLESVIFPSNFVSNKITSLQSVFYFCNKLQSLSINDWDTSNVTNIASTFFGCQSLVELDISNWNLSNVADEDNRSLTFKYCNKLETVYCRSELEVEILSSCSESPSTINFIVKT